MIRGWEFSVLPAPDPGVGGEGLEAESILQLASELGGWVSGGTEPLSCGV